MAGLHNRTMEVVYTSKVWFLGICAAIRRVPTRRVDQELAEEVGAKARNARQLIRVFRELGMINADGSLTARGKKMALGGDSYHKAISEGVRELYGEFLTELVGAKVSRTGEIARRLGDAIDSGLGESARLQAARFLRFLVGESGVDEWTVALEAASQGEEAAAKGPHKTRRGGGRRSEAATTRQHARKQTCALGALDEEAAEQIVTLRLTYGTARLCVPWRLNKTDLQRLQRQIAVFEMELTDDEEALNR